MSDININKYLSARRDYVNDLFQGDELPEDPLVLFEHWFSYVAESFVNEPNAMMLSTATPEGKPSSRIVLLRSIDDGGFTFFTNYNSRKGKQMEKNPNVSLSFFWIELALQVHIEGTAKKIDPALSDAYFESRPEISQLSAWASEQSTEIEGREELENKVRIYKEKFEGKPIPRPSNWGGMNVIPERMEFWQGRKGRLHDRLLYLRKDKKWTIKRLSP